MPYITLTSREDVLKQARRLAFGHAVRARRLELRLSQHMLAERVGCDRETITRLETGAHSQLLDLLWKVADALEADLADLIRSAKAGTNDYVRVLSSTTVTALAPLIDS